MSEKALLDWQWTLNASVAGEEGRASLPNHETLGTALNERAYITNWVFQLEKVNRYHYQGTLRCSDRKAKGTLLRDLSNAGIPTENLTFRPTSNNGRASSALDFYCTKVESRVQGPWTDPGYVAPRKRPKYEGKDLACMETPLLWQTRVLDWIEGTPDDRSVRWIYNKDGNAGKSKLQKFLCWKGKATMIPMGTATQLKTAVIAKGPFGAYVCNIGRVTGNQESQKDLFSALEAIKDGFVESAMYGKAQTLFMEPPHVIVFSNDLPDLRLASLDRWKVYEVKDQNDFLHDLPTRVVLAMVAAKKETEPGAAL